VRLRTARSVWSASDSSALSAAAAKLIEDLGHPE